MKLHNILRRNAPNNDSKLDVWSHIETFQARRAVVMLGASNLTRSFPIAISMSQQVFNGPLAIYVAKGHGRSYGQESSCLGKKISGIFSCGIWRSITQEKSMPITAFMTDIGNDLAYEVPVETVFSWVETCLDRLLSLEAQVVLSDLPLAVLRGISAARYRWFRAVLFPQCRLTLNEMLRRAERLSACLHELAENRNIPLFTAQKQWYGPDPIHPRRRSYPEMWSQLFCLSGERVQALSPPPCSLTRAWYLRCLRPEVWSTFAVSRSALQPNGRLTNGTTISLY